MQMQIFPAIAILTEFTPSYKIKDFHRKINSLFWIQNVLDDCVQLKWYNFMIMSTHSFVTAAECTTM